MSPPKSTFSSSDNGSGFQRGFLLNKPTTKGRAQRKSTDSLPSKASVSKTTKFGETKPPVSRLVPDSPLAEPAVKSKERNIKKEKKQNPTNTKKKKTTAATGETKLKQEGANGRNENGKDSGWCKGFLTNRNVHKKNQKKGRDGAKKSLPDNGRDSEAARGQQDLPSGNGPKTIRSSSNILLSIDDDNGDNGRNVARIVATAKNAPTIVPSTTSSIRKPLISIVLDESANETASGSGILQREKSTVSCNEGGIEGSADVATTKFSSKSLITPLISVRRNGEDYQEKMSPSVLIKEVSTTRKPKHERGQYAELKDGGEKEPTSINAQTRGSSATNIMKDESSDHKPTTASATGSTHAPFKMDEEKHEKVSGLTNDRIRNCTNILRFQQELERLFARPTKGQDQHKNDDLQAISIMQFRTPEHRRYAWDYVLQQRHHRQLCRQKIRIKNSREKHECDYRIRALFEAEFFRHRQQRNETVNRDYDASNKTESRLESVLRCLETELDRKMALEAVLTIHEYFLFRYKEQEQHDDIAQSSMIIAEVKTQAESIQRLMPLFVRLTLLSIDDRRTTLVQAAWETAILLFCFCIRESSEMQPSTVCNLPAAFWENLDLLLQQHLIWQESKAKPNAAKIVRLNEVRMKSENIPKDRNAKHKTLASLVELLDELVADLGKLIGL